MSSAASRACPSVSATTSATGSPTKHTFSAARNGRTGHAPFDPSLFSTGIVSIAFVAPIAARSAAVSTSATPSASAAPLTSSSVIRACATGERKTKACSAPSGAMSST